MKQQGQGIREDSMEKKKDRVPNCLKELGLPNILLYSWA